MAPGPFSVQPFEGFALCAIVADAGTTFLGLRAGARERHIILRAFAKIGGLRLPWAPGLVMLALAAWQHYYNWSRFINEDYQFAGWVIVTTAHVAVAALNIESLAEA